MLGIGITKGSCFLVPVLLTCPEWS